MKINITKRFLLSLCLMTLTLLCGENKAWAADATVTSTFKDKNWSVGTGEPSWTSSGAATNAFESRGVQITLKNINASGLKLSNSSIKDLGNIKSITLTVSSNGTGGEISSVKVGSTSFLNNGSSSYSVAKKNGQVVTFETNTPIADDIIISFTSTATSSSLYIKSIAVTYETTPAPKFSLTEGTYNGPQHVTITAPDKYTGGIVYTTDGSNPTTSDTAENYTDSGIDITTTTTLRAVARNSEGNFSSEATATYTIRSTDQKTYSVKFDFSKPADYGYSAPKKGNGTNLAVGKTIVSGDVTITHVKNGTNTKTRFWNSGGTITFRTYKGAELTISVPAGYVITSIETQGTEGVFSLGGNTAEGGVSSWEGISQTVALNNITTSATLTTMTVNYRLLSFSDADDFTEYLPETALANQTVILDRKILKGWNTFCVPFALTKEQLKEAYGDGAVAKYLSDVTTDGENATLHFTPEAEGGIEANKAYLLYLTGDVTEAKTFSGVTLEPAGRPDGLCPTTVSASNGDYTFQGILKPTTLATNDRQYFLNSAGTNFVLPSNSTSAMKATRAYIIVPPASATAQGRQYSFDFNGTTTGIDNVNISGLEDGAWYTISGIRVNRPAAKGVYIHNGRKVIVK